jgi:hypothetical protein
MKAEKVIELGHEPEASLVDRDEPSAMATAGAGSAVVRVSRGP